MQHDYGGLMPVCKEVIPHDDGEVMPATISHTRKADMSYDGGAVMPTNLSLSSGEPWHQHIAKRL